MKRAASTLPGSARVFPTVAGARVPEAVGGDAAPGGPARAQATDLAGLLDAFLSGPSFRFPFVNTFVFFCFVLFLFIF